MTIPGEIWVTLDKKGNGVLQDYEEAERWYYKAAAQEYEPAWAQLALMYEKTDRVRAYMWLSLIATLSSNPNRSGFAREGRDDVASHMTVEEIKQAQKLARRCQETKFKQCG